MNSQYSLLIQWSDEDQAFLVSFPEFDGDPHTHGTTYKEAFKNAMQVLELLVESYQAEGMPLPRSWKYGEKRSERKKGRQARRHAKSA